MNRKSVSNSRRHFLGQVGGLTTATIATGLLNVEGTAQDEAAQSFPNKREARANQAMQLRNQAAEAQRKLPFTPHQNNGDEDLYANRIACYSKALLHNDLGEVNLKAYESLLQALKTCKNDDYELIQLGGSVKLANPQAAMAFEMEGADPHHLSMPPPPSFNSAEQAGEMVELYWHAVTRDVHFSDYEENQFTTQAAVELSQLTAFRGPKNSGNVIPATLFRGNLPGDLVGPYLSQFLWLDIPYGAMTIQQRYNVPQAENDQMTFYEDWLNIQNGGPGISNYMDELPRYLRNGRDLAGWVHKDFSYQGFLNAALILLNWGQPALDPYNPYVGSATQGGFCTFGGPYILDLVSRVANAALKTAWYQKWHVHRRIRPEEYGGRIHNHLTKTTQYDLHPEVLNASVLEIVNNETETYLLPQAYPEGCPTHPAYPSGHAIIAGACATVLKAYFNENFVIPNPMIANADGTALEQYPVTGLRAGGEINKLASNIAFGRNIAGIHWRSDATEGLKLGEAVAIGILTDLKTTCHEKFRGFRLTKFDGATVVV
ncbi:MAG: vanadium-dependent haloperoxidase [Acidobacteria bacterium]|nr:vanadium-dependent haloperoxidase [Acidobacteriota bacterium]